MKMIMIQHRMTTPTATTTTTTNSSIGSRFTSLAFLLSLVCVSLTNAFVIPTFQHPQHQLQQCTVSQQSKGSKLFDSSSSSSSGSDKDSTTSSSTGSTTTTPQSTTTTTTTTTTTPTTQTTTLTTTTQTAVLELKKVLEREYLSFFNPMRTEYYASDVTFDDPLTNLMGVQAYQTNVDMLSGRTMLGNILFQDGSISLHSITGGTVVVSSDTTTTTTTTSTSSDTTATITISDIVTRWTLRFTMKVFPWKPTARFSGISIYKVKPIPTKPGVQIIGQTDYWDSINLIPNNQEDNNDNNKVDGSDSSNPAAINYQKVPKTVALKDFIQQLTPGGFQAVAAAPELPYSLLRRGMGGYEVRRYPAYTAVRIRYGRRDEGFGTLGAFTKSTESASSPAIMTVESSSDEKYMMWPLTYSMPGQGGKDDDYDDTIPPEPKLAMEKIKDAQWRKCEIMTYPSSVVAVLDFSDVSMEPVVRKADAQLRHYLQRDGLVPKRFNMTSNTTTTTTESSVTDSSPRRPEKQPFVKFAQYDAIFSMGKRRSEVWIELEDGGHPW